MGMQRSNVPLALNSIIGTGHRVVIVDRCPAFGFEARFIIWWHHEKFESVGHELDDGDFETLCTHDLTDVPKVLEGAIIKFLPDRFELLVVQSVSKFYICLLACE